MNLVIVESPGKAPHVREHLPHGYLVDACVGHILRIPPRGLNIDIKNNFTPVYEVMPEKVDVVERLRELSKQAEIIYIATDKDREGEMIGKSVYDQLDATEQKRCKRIVYTEVTDKGIQEALKNPRGIDPDLVDAQRARQVIDRLVGYLVSPQLWAAVAPRTSAGRVQSVALRLICERQIEIDNFKPEIFWCADAHLKAKEGSFWARVFLDDKSAAKVKSKDKDEEEQDTRDRIRSKADLDTILKQLKDATFTLAKVERKSKNQKANPPFDTASMQAAANAVLDWNASKTMEVAQSLFEKGAITYHRTDSFTLSDDAVADIRKHIEQNFPNKYLPAKPNVYKQKSTAGTQEAHEAIRPTNIEVDGSLLMNEEKALYCLVRDRVLACQMSDQVIDTVVYLVKASSGHTLIAKGQSVGFDGWRKVWKHSKTKEVLLPKAEKGEALGLLEVVGSERATKPPSRYTDGALNIFLRNNCIGRPATQAAMIDTLLDRQYMVHDGKMLVPTDLGMKVYQHLIQFYRDFFLDINFSSNLEDDLKDIANGTKKFLPVVQSFYDRLSQIMGDRINDNLPVGARCPVCQKGDILQKHGKFGSYYSCGNYPDCKTVFTKEGSEFVPKAPPRDTGETCQVCGKGKIVMRQGQYGAFFACDQFPNCRTTYKREKGAFVKK